MPRWAPSQNQPWRLRPQLQSWCTPAGSASGSGSGGGAGGSGITDQRSCPTGGLIRLPARSLQRAPRPGEMPDGDSNLRERRGWDSNPRTLAGRRFSRPEPSTTRPPLQQPPGPGTGQQRHVPMSPSTGDLVVAGGSRSCRDPPLSAPWAVVTRVDWRCRGCRPAGFPGCAFRSSWPGSSAAGDQDAARPGRRPRPRPHRCRRP